MTYQRSDRQYVSGTDDGRTQYQRDRDRILYSSALQRLAGVTQVVGAAEGVIFHNRLTHTLEVAQVGRRLAERLLRQQPELIEKTSGVDPDVVEAAALAHDLGHPPFGHVAEHELDILARKNGAADGFEGNAQSFRILTRLTAHRADYRGLDLTRAVLNAVLKYPWLRDLTHTEGNPNPKYRKFGAYQSDQEAFQFARGDMAESDARSVEAQIMDVADEIAYSVHDLDDFFRAGLIPLGVLTNSDLELEAYFKRWVKRGRVDPNRAEDRKDSLKALMDVIGSYEEYRGAFRQKAERQEVTSLLIGDFIRSVSLVEDSGDIRLEIDPDKKIEMQFLQGLVWDYVILNPRLATQQRGLRQIIRSLFDIYMEAVEENDRQLIPPQFLVDLDAMKETGETKDSAARLATDIVASFADEQAITMYRRILGVNPGSVAQILHG